MMELVLGGARSGKSAYAERRAHEIGATTIYLATARAGDAEMAARIAAHRTRRPSTWQLVEEPIRLAHALQTHASSDRCLIVDCLTLWLSNLLLTDIDPNLATGPEAAPTFEREHGALVAALPRLRGTILFVSNEVGMGVVPLGALARRFCDEAGRLNQMLAGVCTRVTWVAAGLPLTLKDTSA